MPHCRLSATGVCKQLLLVIASHCIIPSPVLGFFSGNEFSPGNSNFFVIELICRWIMVEYATVCGQQDCIYFAPVMAGCILLVLLTTVSFQKSTTAQYQRRDNNYQCFRPLLSPWFSSRCVRSQEVARSRGFNTMSFNLWRVGVMGWASRLKTLHENLPHNCKIVKI